MNEFLKMHVPTIAFALSAQDVRIYANDGYFAYAKYQILDIKMKGLGQRAATTHNN